MGRIDETVTVGDHPQRIRNGFVARGLLDDLTRPADLAPYEPMPPLVTPLLPQLG